MDRHRRARDGVVDARVGVDDDRDRHRIASSSAAVGSDGCAPALVTASGVNASDLATIARADGTKQVTYKGHPLYYFVDDSGAGMTTGQGSDNFGAKWWLVGPSGAAISAKVSSSGSSNASASTGGAYGGSSNGGY